MKINNDEILSLHYHIEPNSNLKPCENCNNNIDNKVYSCFGWIDNFKDYYTVYLCNDCLQAYLYSEALPNNCKNIYNI